MKAGKLTCLLLSGALLLGLGCAAAAEAGSAGDPLISLSWLTDSFAPSVAQQANARVDEVFDQMALDASGGEELLVKQGDMLHLESGASMILFSGELSVSVQGTVVDVTDGTEMPAAGFQPAARHRYLAAERTAVTCTVLSDTAVIRTMGGYRLNCSGEVDYNALALGLRQLGLFKGTDTAYGYGFDLEETPTRIQGLIMFLRLLGEEEAALSFTGAVSFADVPLWALPYVAYAYDRGYTKGQGLNSDGRVIFGTEGTLAARDYVTFLLRALGYQEGSQFQWLTATEDAGSLGLLTEGERALLKDSPFHRAQVVYLSYYTLLDSQAGEKGTLLESLIAKGTVLKSDAEAVVGSITVQRL